MKKFKKNIPPWQYKVKFQDRNFAGIVKSTAYRTSFVDDSKVQAAQTPGAKYKVNESLVLKRVAGPKYLLKDNRNKSYT